MLGGVYHSSLLLYLSMQMNNDAGAVQLHLPGPDGVVYNGTDNHALLPVPAALSHPAGAHFRWQHQAGCSVSGTE